MKKFLSLYYVLAILLVGCAEIGTKPVWSKSGVDTEQVNRDLAECQRAERLRASLRIGGERRGVRQKTGGMRQTVQQSEIVPCMREKGYKLAK